MNNLDLQTKILSDYLGVDKAEFKKRKILNPTFNKDVRLFIDPVLLKTSEHKIFSQDARAKYENFFQKLYERILVSKELNGKDKEKAQKGIIQNLKFGEMKQLCLGYSRYGTAGRGTGNKIATILYNSAEKLIYKGVENTGIFSVLFLLEEGFGPDYISDMTAHIIIQELAIFTEKIASDLVIKTDEYTIGTRIYHLPKHPLYNTYVLFIPNDILSPLDKVLDVKDVLGRFCNSGEDNDAIRQRINQDIAEILEQASENKSPISEIKKKAKDYVTEDSNALDALRVFVNKDKKIPYDSLQDKLGVNIISELAEIFKNVKPSINKQQTPLNIIDGIIEGYVKTIENNNKILSNLEDKKESSWQDAFLLYCKRTCEENNIDIAPERETGLGPIDFVFSQGSSFKDLIEMKLSSNPNAIRGLEKQLEIYKKCLSPITKAYYIYVDLEKDIKKSDKRKQNLLNRKKDLELDSEIVFIDGKVKPSASKA